MEEIGKEESKVIEEEGLNQTKDHTLLEGPQEPNPNSVDTVIVEMQKLIGESGVEMPADTAGPVDSAPTVPEAAEDAEIGTGANDEPQGDTGGDKVGSHVYSDMHCKTEVGLEVESDKVVSNVESDVRSESEVAAKVEGDNVVGSVDFDVQHESEVSVENVSVKNAIEENGGEKREELKDVEVSKVRELDGGAETGDLVGDGDGVLQQAAQTTMEIEKGDNDGEEGKALKDGESSKADPSNEVQIDAETDGVVSQVEPDICGDGEVAKEKMADGWPSNEVHMDVVASQVEPDKGCDAEVANEKLTDGVSSKAKPSSEPLTSAENDRVVCKLEHEMPRDSKIAKQKLVDAVRSQAKRSPIEPHSSVKELKANNVCKVERGMPQDDEVSMETESESDDEDEKRHPLTGGLSSKTKFPLHHNIKEQLSKSKVHVEREVGRKSSNRERNFLLDPGVEGDESGTEEEQAEFMKEVEKVYRENYLEFKPPKFYKEELNLLKLWRAVIKLGGYEKVTSCKLWRQVGESFNPPKTCTTVSWTFRIFYEKALLEFEKHRWHGSELALPEPSRVDFRADGSQICGSGRTLRDAAARAMQGWHTQRLFANGEEKPLSTMPKSDKQLKSSGLLKRKKLSPGDSAAQASDMKATRPRLDMTVFDIGPPADWVKVNVKRFNDCFEVYALIPGLLREEVHVQSDPVGRLIISGQPMQLDNPWGVAPFKKVVSLPSRIDPHQTSAVVTLNGQLFVRVPFEQSDF
ncbi:AT-rich interactive domain-containing protein 3-like isoform X2 [Argentina anserina]|uniref:AT-rich interactive domain-containing protein 3-like isoform X2 n=1 Tax=Argentina anserina TaxID=57926 RepID=UPI0021764D06|nr:AT-rich interactive domain-containing protein 3-like isoform X2 [Potentilla anserina]